MQKRKIGATGIEVDVLGVGAAPLGGNFADLDRDQAASLLQTALDAGLTYVDTAPFYGFGRSERVVGDMLRERPYVLSTKVGRLLAPGAAADPMAYGMIDPLPFRPIYDYTYDGVMRSFEDSQQRLGLDRIDILLVHDIGEFQHGKEENDRHFADLEAGGYRALAELRSAGKVSAIGLGVNENEICLRSLDIGDKILRNMDDFVSNEYEFKILKINKDRRNVVVSRRELLEAEKAKMRSEIMSDIISIIFNIIYTNI